MKNNLRNSTTATARVILLFVFSFALMTACERKSKNVAHDTYTCPMHPQIIRDKPGSCPICGMDLMKRERANDKISKTVGLNDLLQPANEIIVSAIRTVLPVHKGVALTMQADGMITYDTRRVTSIPIRFGGRIEKLWINYNFQPIRKGQKILEIYSPELITAQRDLLNLLKSDSENRALIEAATEKLKLLGVSDSQLNELISSQHESYSFSVFSPLDGYVLENEKLSASEESENSSMGNEMPRRSNAKDASLTIKDLKTREGMYVNPGQVIFQVVNTDQVWAEFNIDQRNGANIHVNDQAQVIFNDGTELLETKVSFIQPSLTQDESFIKVRIQLSNEKKKFQVGQLVKALFKKTSDGLWIPRSVRLDLGLKKICFVKRGSVFYPIEIITARQSDDWIEVIHGVNEKDSLASNAQFMIDSESFIKVNN